MCVCVCVCMYIYIYTYSFILPVYVYREAAFVGYCAGSLHLRTWGDTYPPGTIRWHHWPVWSNKTLGNAHLQQLALSPLSVRPIVFCSLAQNRTQNPKPPSPKSSAGKASKLTYLIIFRRSKPVINSSLS